MKRIFTLLLGTFLAFTVVCAQEAPPQAFSFKAMIKDAKGNPVVLKPVSLRISILRDASNGLPVYVETFLTSTNLYAQVDLEIGRGTSELGIFSSIDWALDEYFIKVEVDVKAGTNYQLMSVSQLLSVPYAMYAGNLSGGQDNDNDPVNELISNVYLSGTVLSIVEAGITTMVDLSGLLYGVDASTTNELQNLILNGHELTIENGNTITLPTDEIIDPDADPNNEIQTMTLEGNILTLTTNDAPIQIDLTRYIDNTDSQTLTITDHTLSISGGNQVVLPDNVDDADNDLLNEIQQISIDGDRITLSRDGGYVDIPSGNVINGMFVYGDKDGDNYGDPFKALWIPTNVSPPAGYVVIPNDCDDMEPRINPGVSDICDGIDNDCDGQTDENCLAPELYEALLLFFNCATEGICEGFDPECIMANCDSEVNQILATEGGECALELLMNPESWLAIESMNNEERANYFVMQCSSPDEDEDGFTVRDGDCNDADPAIYPGAPEVCGDGIDQNCNGHDQVCGDDDDDTYTEEQGDCNDNDPNIHPGAIDYCDGIDNDCDGEIDEDADWQTYYFDSDHDGWGNTDVSDIFCDEERAMAEGYAFNGGDCNDTDPEINPGIDEATEEYCGDGIDQDCSGADLPCSFLSDDDEDGFSEVNGDCDDTNPLISPAGIEVCGDGIDQNCNGRDQVCGDNDDDGFTPEEGDCDDYNPSVYPGAPEVCGDGIDQDCNGILDDGCCFINIVDLVNCMDESGCSLSNPSCVISNCPEMYNVLMETECVDFQCILSLISDPEFPVDEPPEIKAIFIMSRCGTVDNDGDGFPGMEGDCNDMDPAIHPGATEICGDGIDQDCDGVDPAPDHCADDDGDGFSELQGDCNDSDPSVFPGASEICGDGIDQNCNGTDAGCDDNDEDGYTIAEGDCNDEDPTVFPGAEEPCDGKDNNCNGQIDEYARQFYLDIDGDGWGNPEIFVMSCDWLDGYTEEGGDCDDSDPSVHPFAGELCGDGIDQNCDGTDPPSEACIDGDEDGYSPLQGDCNDEDPTIHPYAEEILDDGIDQDCNGSDLKATDLEDDDGDGFTEVNGDCDDTNPEINPSMEDICGDGIDNNCDGAIDENVPVWYRDSDSDGYGTYSEFVSSCDFQQGYSEIGGDCDDSDPDINPGAADICGDGIDQNCSGADASCDDLDEDGFSAPMDCDDNNRNVNPEAEEICDGIDNNCDGEVDENQMTFYRDQDRDGFGTEEEQIIDCSPPDGFAEIPGDCDDYNEEINPEAPEICDNLDNNCNGDVDEGLILNTYYIDSDGDGYGSFIGESTTACTQPDGFVDNDLDCDDFNATVYPGAFEVCSDGIDQDCDGMDIFCPEDIDDDGDGYTENIGDCNDTNPSIYPGAPEVCDDGVDQNCDGSDLSCRDVDDDGDGYTENQGDCNDFDPGAYPGANEICGDGNDQDCNGSDLSCYDVDNDYDGWTENQGDCNDSDPGIYPGALEICGDGIDQDCNDIDPVCPPTIKLVYPSSLTLTNGTSGIVYVELVEPAPEGGITVNAWSNNSTCLVVNPDIPFAQGVNIVGVTITSTCQGVFEVTFALDSQVVKMTVTVI